MSNSYWGLGQKKKPTFEDLNSGDWFRDSLPGNVSSPLRPNMQGGQFSNIDGIFGGAAINYDSSTGPTMQPGVSRASNPLYRDGKFAEMDKFFPSPKPLFPGSPYENSLEGFGINQQGQGINAGNGFMVQGSKGFQVAPNQPPTGGNPFANDPMSRGYDSYGNEITTGNFGRGTPNNFQMAPNGQAPGVGNLDYLQQQGGFGQGFETPYIEPGNLNTAGFMKPEKVAGNMHRGGIQNEILPAASNSTVDITNTPGTGVSPQGVSTTAGAPTIPEVPTVPETPAPALQPTQRYDTTGAYDDYKDGGWFGRSMMQDKKGNVLIDSNGNPMWEKGMTGGDKVQLGMNIFNSGFGAWGAIQGDKNAKSKIKVAKGNLNLNREKLAEAKNSRKRRLALSNSNIA